MAGFFDQNNSGSAFQPPAGIDPQLLLMLAKMQQGQGLPGMGTPGPGTPIPQQPGQQQPQQQNSGSSGGNTMMQQLFPHGLPAGTAPPLDPSASSGMGGMSNADMINAIQRAMNMYYGTTSQSGSSERGF